MDSLLPVHNALVHVPVGVALVLPLVALVLGHFAFREGSTRTSWLALVAIEAALLGGTYLALESGEIAEEAAEERGVSEDVIHEHEERAELFPWIAGGALALAVAAAVAPAGRVRKALVIAAVLATFPVAGAAAWTGDSGGDVAHPKDAAAGVTPIDDGGGGRGRGRGRGGD